MIVMAEEAGIACSSVVEIEYVRNFVREVVGMKILEMCW